MANDGKGIVVTENLDIFEIPIVTIIFGMLISFFLVVTVCCACRPPLTISELNQRQLSMNKTNNSSTTYYPYFNVLLLLSSLM
ncbi:hypothetical protein BLOT_002345 [Blomia tropicalis]|nr:hypothetical protein BLOT_002345 [Blomia tropicalis]